VRTLVGALLGAAFVAFMIYSVLAEGRVQCEVCVEFRGQRECGSSAAADRDRAIGEAKSNACALLTSGVTNGIQCNATPPASIECSE